MRGDSELDQTMGLLNALGLGVWSWDIASAALEWSEALCRLFGRVPGHAPSSPDELLAMLCEEDRGSGDDVIRRSIERAAASRSPVDFGHECRVALPDGGARWVEGRGRVVVNDEGRPVRVMGICVDVSARKETEHRLRRTEEIHRLIGEVASDYVYSVEFESAVLFPEVVAGSFERTTGMTPDDVRARGGWMEVIHPDDRTALARAVPRLASGQPLVSEYRIVHASGEVRWLRDSIRPIVDPKTAKVVRLVGGVQDVTHQKSLEAQLLQAQKLEALARLSGSIAHDFNNLLAVVMGGASLLKTSALDADQRESCDAITEAAMRGAELTRSLLVFARRDAGSSQVVRMSEVARAALPMLSRAAGTSVQVLLHASEAPPGAPAADFVRIDPGQAQLLLLNLVLNARDAMPEGGEIELRIESGHYAARDGLPGELDAGDFVRLSVSDSGGGIAPEVLPRIFEPFFTTKPRGKGTGLGLAACHGIVQGSAGAIAVESVVGRGTRFLVYWPRVEAAAHPVQEVVARISVGGVERLVLVEDEPELRRLLVRCLIERGYAVRAAGSAEEARCLLIAEPADLIVSDVVLPGQRGDDFAVEVQRRWPETRVLLMSGFVDGDGLCAELPLISKPFTIESLARKVRQVLDAPRSAPAGVL